MAVPVRAQPTVGYAPRGGPSGPYRVRCGANMMARTMLARTAALSASGSGVRLALTCSDTGAHRCVIVFLNRMAARGRGATAERSSEADERQAGVEVSWRRPGSVRARTGLRVGAVSQLRRADDLEQHGREALLGRQLTERASSTGSRTEER